MGFEVVHDIPQKIWMPVMNTDTLYVGQLVTSSNEGAKPLSVASGTGDETNKTDSVGLISNGTSENNLVFGVVVGTNLKTPDHDTTLKAEKITYADPSSVANDTYIGHEGVEPLGDVQARVEVIPLTAESVLRAPLYTDAFGTAPTETTLSGSPTTTAATSAATDESGINSQSTMYVRTGAARGSYRVTTDTGTTSITWDVPLVFASASGDKIVRVNLRPWGFCKMQIDSEAMYVDTGATITTNYFLIDVLRLDLSIAGSEHVEFRFNPYMFQTIEGGT